MKRRLAAAGRIKGGRMKSLYVDAQVAGYSPYRLIESRCPCGGLAKVLEWEYVELVAIKGESILCDDCVRGGE